jgi:hypothetical protein
VARISRNSATIAVTTAAVARLRTATAVATSTPWSSAMRAATWLPPNMQASSSSVAKALGLGASAVSLTAAACP